MHDKKQRLELTWIGKDEQVILEPRILIEDPAKSYGDGNCGNMLIHGDNLLALKALEQDFAGKIKCIYIDPPYNTGNAFEHYDDGLEHSIWLSLIKPRIELLRRLLSDDGVISIHIDDIEYCYLKVLMDEIFGRDNFINTIAIRDSHPSGLKLSAKDKKIIKTKSYIVIYKKSSITTITPIYQSRNDWDTHYSIYIDTHSDKLEKKTLKEVLIERNIINTKYIINETSLRDRNFRKFVFDNRHNIFQSTKEMPDFARKLSIENKDNVIEYISNGERNFAFNGRRLFPLSKSIYNIGIDGEFDKEDFAKLLCDFWDDVDFNNSQNEGDSQFPASKKPEYLLGRILTMFSFKDEYVLDSFLGSGTTAAVAHKMNRKWIGIELGEHCDTHCLPRLQKVVDGADQGGISKAVNWKGGGGFKYYYLAPSLLKEDKYGNWIIDSRYNANMLAAAMAKQEGFKYNPDETNYWKQGKSTEKDFIFTTTHFFTIEHLDKIHEEMQPDESLLICCKSFQKPCENKYPNITVKKIPKMLLGRCEFGKDDYSLNIVNMPIDSDEPIAEFKKQTNHYEPKKAAHPKEPDLFDDNCDKSAN